MRQVLLAQVLRQQSFDGLADQLVAVKTEKPLNLMIDRQDAAQIIRDDDGVGRGLQKMLGTASRSLLVKTRNSSRVTCSDA